MIDVTGAADSNECEKGHPRPHDFDDDEADPPIGYRHHAKQNGTD